ncbi:hypothetical protein PI125_g19305 [Phytophthora idaei]|nr:hypothetical protein PI125_g19305 [Phytophthora idaei]
MSENLAFATSTTLRAPVIAKTPVGTLPYLQLARARNLGTCVDGLTTRIGVKENDLTGSAGTGTILDPIGLRPLETRPPPHGDVHAGGSARKGRRDDASVSLRVIMRSEQANAQGNFYRITRESGNVDVHNDKRPLPTPYIHAQPGRPYSHHRRRRTKVMCSPAGHSTTTVADGHKPTRIAVYACCRL